MGCHRCAHTRTAGARRWRAKRYKRLFGQPAARGWPFVYQGTKQGAQVNIYQSRNRTHARDCCHTELLGTGREKPTLEDQQRCLCRGTGAQVGFISGQGVRVRHLWWSHRKCVAVPCAQLLLLRGWCGVIKACEVPAPPNERAGLAGCAHAHWALGTRTGAAGSDFFRPSSLWSTARC